MISVEEAVATIESRLTPLSVETVALFDALGRVLAEDIASTRAQPAVAVEIV